MQGLRIDSTYQSHRDDGTGGDKKTKEVKDLFFHSEILKYEKYVTKYKIIPDDMYKQHY